YDVLLHTRNQLLAPGLDVVFIASLEQHEEPHSSEASDELFCMQRAFQQLGKFRQDLLTADDADIPLDCRKLVELDQGDTAHAAGGSAFQAHVESFDH